MATHLDVIGNSWTGQLYSGGWHRSKTATDLPVLDKATGELLTETAEASRDDLERAVSLAESAQVAWANTPPAQRREVLIQFAALLKEHQDELIDWLIRESGSVRAKAEAELGMAYGEALEAAAMPTQPYGSLLPSANPTTVTSIARRVPRGIIGVISPWNFPLILALRSVAPALALGNAVILKPDSQTPICGGLFLARLLEEAGLPHNVFHVLPGGAELGSALVTHPAVSTISFTGSTAVGRSVNQAAAPLLKKVILELGGNNAFIVLDDADVNLAASCGAWGSFLHQGQICMTIGRHIVHHAVADEYIARLSERAEKLPVGNPSTETVALGPLINDRQAERVHQLVHDAVRSGAQVVTGGAGSGRLHPATVLRGVTPSMAVFRDEIFGPVAPVVIVSSDDEAVAVANSTEFGLSAAVHSASPHRALAIGKQLRAGLVHINDQTVNYESYIPFGGMGSTGNGGRFGAASSVEEFTEWQWITVRDTPTEYPF